MCLLCSVRKKTRGSGSEPEKEDKLMEDHPSTTSLGEGTLPCDPNMWAHLQYARTEVQAASTTREQLEKLAMSVSVCV